jgi:ATP synthase protein I
MSDKEIHNLSSKISKLKSEHPDLAPPAAKIKKSDNVKGEHVLAELVAGLLFGLFLGYAIDSYFDTKPLFMIILIILGLAGSFYNIYKAVR